MSEFRELLHGGLIQEVFSDNKAEQARLVEAVKPGCTQAMRLCPDPEPLDPNVLCNVVVYTRWAHVRKHIVFKHNPHTPLTLSRDSARLNLG